VSDLRRRTVTAVIYGAVVLVALLLPSFAFWAVLALVAVLGLTEVAALRVGAVGFALGALFLGGLASLGVLRSLGPIGAHHETAGDLPVWLLLVLLPTWAGDVSAYVIGSRFGHRKLAPRVSPGKTWEGTVAGVIACGAAAFGVGALFGLGRVIVVVIALLLGVVGLAGDLFESSVKRRAGVKDSGTLLPGHGGVLDRLDSTVTGSILVLIVYSLGTAGGLG
jgi:phosphatidate cytidylyltransferase